MTVLRDFEGRDRKESGALRQSEELYRAVLEQAAENIFVIDPDTKRILEANAALHRSLGYAPEELKEMTLYDVVAHDRESINDNIRRILEHKRYSVGERKYRRKDGSLVTVEVNVSIVPYGGKEAMCIVAHDVTERKRAEEALRESEERFRVLAEEAVEGILLIEDGRVIDANRAYAEMYGYTLEELIGIDVIELSPPDLPEEVARRISTGNTEPYEAQGLRKDGTVFPIEIRSRSIPYHGRQTRVTSVLDLTERRRAENELRRSLSILLALREAGEVLGSTLESEEIVTRLLEIMRGVAGLTAAVISGGDETGNIRIWRSVGLEALWSRIRFVPEAMNARRAVLEHKEQQLFRLRRPGSTEESLVALYLPLKVKDRVMGVLEAYGSESLAQSVTVEVLSSLTSQAATALENARLYEELAERGRELQDLVGKLLGAQEEERRRVAYEVHDGLAQVASAAHQHLQAFARRYSPDAEAGRRDMERILRLVRGTVSDARRIMANLRPTTLDDLGLAATISLEIERLQEEGYQIEYEEDLGEERLPNAVEIALFRVAQEALTNVRKHAQTRRVRLELRRRGREVHLEVQDYGRGFDPSAAPLASGPGERVGLAGMRERVGMLGGELKIRSRPEAGTSITAIVPLTRVP